MIGTARSTYSLDGLDLAQLRVTDDAGVTAAFAAAGDVDIVVINPAGIFYAAVEAIPLDELQQLFNLNTVGALRVAQAALPDMRARGEDKLLFMSSVLGRVALPNGAAYAATKWALEAVVEALAIEVRPFGIQPALLEPGAVSSGARDNVKSYTLPEDPYAGLAGDDEVRRAIITPNRSPTRSPTPPGSHTCRCGFRLATLPAPYWLLAARIRTTSRSHDPVATAASRRRRRRP